MRQRGKRLRFSENPGILQTTAGGTFFFYSRISVLRLYENVL